MVMYERLVTFGCSLTYGQWLDDCVPPDDENPSTYAWPNIIANKFDLRLSNLSEPGSSNKQIWKTILDTKLSANDLVIIQWSHVDRWCVIKENGVNEIGIWQVKKDKISRAFFENLYNNHDMKIDFNCRSDHIDRYLCNLGIDRYHFTSNEKNVRNKPVWNSANFLPVYANKTRKKFPTALDGSHPGKLAHKNLAEQIYAIIYDFNKN